MRSVVADLLFLTTCWLRLQHILVQFMENGDHDRKLRRISHLFYKKQIAFVSDYAHRCYPKVFS